MMISKHHITGRSILQFFLVTFLFDTGIAIFLTAIQFGAGFSVNFIISQCIGLSICGCVVASHRLIGNAGPLPRTVIIAAALLIGTIGGSYLGALLAGLSPSLFFSRHSILQMLLLGVMFGVIIIYFFASREQIAAAQAEALAEKIKRLTIEKMAAETNLRMLEARIEPHFLFNTLSNIVSLLERDPEKGRSMLNDFIHYLRISLTKIRKGDTTLGQELEMIRAYLNLFKIRMDHRLQYRIELPEHLRSTPFPPMLIQPLVENAIKHGLEPEIDGGEIVVNVRDENGLVQVEVVDTGTKFKGESATGMGLANIRERLFSLYGQRGRLLLTAHLPKGLKATIEVPRDAD